MSRRSRVLIGFGIAFVALNLVPNLSQAMDLPGFYLTFLFTSYFWIGQASSWNILTGYTGYFSFGQGAWFGIGVYTTGILAAKQGWPFLAALPVAGVLAGIAGLVMGLVVFRLRKLAGEIFALTTLAVAFVLAAAARLFSFVDGGRGIFMTGTPLPEFLGDFRNAMYRMTLLIALLTVLVAYLIYESRLGWGLFAIRDDETVAAGLGVPAFRYKMTALGANAFFSGLMGGVWALQIGFIGVEEVFNIRVPLFVILMSVLGGMRHWMGPVVGAVIIYTLTDRLNSAGEVATPLGTINFIDVNQIIIGGLLIVMVLAVREGIFLRMRERWLTSSIAFGGTMAVLVAFDLADSLVWDFAYSALVMVIPLLVPVRLYDRLLGRVAAAAGSVDADAAEEVPEEVGS